MWHSFNAEKAINGILWIASKSKYSTFHTISKLMYLADKEHLAEYGRLIFGDSYVAMKHGPVPSETYDMLKAVRGDGWTKFMEEAKSAFEVKGKKEVIPIRLPDLNVFSESDLECLQKTFEIYGKMTFRELTDITHDQAWESVDENDLIELEQIIATLPNSEVLLDHIQNTTHV